MFFLQIHEFFSSQLLSMLSMLGKVKARKPRFKVAEEIIFVEYLANNWQNNLLKQSLYELDSCFQAGFRQLEPPETCNTAMSPMSNIEKNEGKACPPLLQGE